MYVSNASITVLRGYCEDPDYDDLVPDNRPRTNRIPVEIVQDSRDRSESARDDIESTVRYLTMNVPRTLDISKNDRFTEHNYGGTYKVTDVDNMSPPWTGHKTVSARLDASGSF